MVDKQYKADIEAIIAKRYDNGGDYWASADGRLAVGNPFSTISCVLMLNDLGVSLTHPILKGATDLIFKAWREDGRFRLAPSGTLYPCYTATTARILCQLGYVEDIRLKKTFNHLLEIQHEDGGWRCKKFSFGRGPETEYSNPLPTLEALAAFRYTNLLNNDERLDKAVEFLLEHWVIRKPLGPCHYGIGARFMKVSYPLYNYNIFFYVYTLSFYDKAKNDHRFLEALRALEDKLVNGKVVVEYPNRKLAGLSFCKKGEPSDLATEKYHEILQTLNNR